MNNDSLTLIIGAISLLAIGYFLSQQQIMIPSFSVPIPTSTGVQETPKKTSVNIYRTSDGPFYDQNYHDYYDWYNQYDYPYSYWHTGYPFYNYGTNYSKTYGRLGGSIGRRHSGRRNRSHSHTRGGRRSRGRRGGR